MSGFLFWRHSLFPRFAGVVFVFGMLTSCSGGVTSSSFGLADSTSLDSGPAGSSDGISESTKFYVGIDAEINKIAHVHKEGTFGTQCAIDPTQALSDIRCIIDTPEAEIINHGMAFIYNVPPGMCNYLLRKTYWYYNNEVGIGPQTLTLARSFTDGTLISSSCTFDGGGSVSCDSHPEVLFDVVNAKPTCVYDRSLLTNGSNGCFGDYSLTVTDTNTTTGPPLTVTTSVTQSSASWGGDMSKVSAGAIKYADWPVTANKVPTSIITPSDEGLLSQKYTLAIKDTLSPVTWDIANYYTPAKHSHTGFFSLATVSTQPYFIAPIDDRNGSLISATSLIGPTQESYEFQCLDQAFEVLQRIRVYVREWDTYQKYSDFITSKGTDITAVDDTPGLEGGGCTGITGDCNDFLDVDNFVDILGGYDMTAPAIPLRSTYFPNIVYDAN